MIKKMSYKKIMKATLFIIILSIFYLFPSKDKYSLISKNVSSSSNYHDIYLVDKRGYTSKTTISVSSIEKKKLTKDLLLSLTINSKNKFKVPNNFYSVIPENTKVLDVKIGSDIINVLFSKEILKVSKNKKEQMIECIVYTLTSINNIKKIELSVEGDKSFFNEYYTRNIGANKKYDIDSLNNIKSVTIYYVSKDDNVNYYVPVTKYINSKDDKIKIIISELSSKTSLDSNLMSFLNYETKLINYNIEDKDVYLYFDDAILNNRSDNKILEEVVYSISYSIEDSYSPCNVHFLVNGKEF